MGSQVADEYNNSENSKRTGGCINITLIAFGAILFISSVR